MKKIKRACRAHMKKYSGVSPPFLLPSQVTLEHTLKLPCQRCAALAVQTLDLLVESLKGEGTANCKKKNDGWQKTPQVHNKHLHKTKTGLQLTCNAVN